MTLYLIRHASAGNRSVYSGDDLQRPLDERGEAQALAIAAHLADCEVRAVWSSIATRCVDTVVPVAADHGLEVAVRDELTEGGRPSKLLESMRVEASLDDDLIMCSHGDLIPDVLSRLLREGMSVVGPRGCEKGSIWALETRGSDITRGTYLAKP